MDISRLQVLPIHKYPQYMKECCRLINEEWHRSERARMFSLEASCDKLPTSLILLSDDDKVIGHCKLSIIPSIRESCFIESFVISKELRGQKLGTFLMKKTEEYCKNVLHLKSCYLSTKGQEHFYYKLGYRECPPISLYGGFNFKFIFGSPKRVSTVKTDDKSHPPNKSVQNVDVTKNNIMNSSVPTSTCPPPPPPMPVMQASNNTTSSNKKTFMFKTL